MVAQSNPDDVTAEDLSCWTITIDTIPPIPKAKDLDRGSIGKLKKGTT
jgi:hypothetical protein